MRLPGAPGASQLTATRDEWRQAAENIAAAGGRLISLWASRDASDRDVVHAAFAADAALLQLNLPLAASEACFPALDDLFPAANRLQRALADLSGLRTTSADTRPWLRHAGWPFDISSIDARSFTAAERSDA